MSSSGHFIPQELSDRVIDEAAQISGKASPNRTLSSIALLSHACRNRANKHRFSTISFSGETATASHIRTLRDLMNSDVWSQEAGIARHVRNLTIKLQRSARTVHKILDDGSLASILHRIFRGTGHPQAPNGIFMLSLSLPVPSRKGDSVGLSYASLNEDFKSALKDICTNSYLVTLKLNYLDDIPPDLLHGSALKHLHLDNVGFLDSSDVLLPASSVDSGPVYSPLAHLETLDTNHVHSCSLRRIIGAPTYNALGPEPALPGLNALSIEIYGVESFERTYHIVENVVTLKKLTFRMNIFDVHLGSIEFYDQLPQLEKLSIIYNANIFHEDPSYRQNLEKVPHVLQPNLPPIRHLHITLSLRGSDLDARTPSDIFDAYHDFSILDDFISSSLPPSLEKVSFLFEVTIYPARTEDIDTRGFKKDASVYARRLFPRLAASQRPVLEICIRLILDYENGIDTPPCRAARSYRAYY
ncbi:hypothetical protein BDZ97DRAFT_1921310 [Flammula alnicola]|nr:hypothetical protein BDZ97DRAFT_1921310 [Flammula alnicola]